MSASKKPNWLQKINRRIASAAAVARLLAFTLHHLDLWVLRLSGGRFTAATFFTGLAIIELTTTGAKSGLPRSMPLLSIPHDDDRLVIIASNWGQKRHPAWYHNILANPQVTVTRDGHSQTYLARETEGAERAACWRLAVQTYAGYADYAQRVTNRQIPVILLSPATAIKEK